MESVSNGSVEPLIETDGGRRKRRCEFGDSSEDPAPSVRSKTRRRLSAAREEDSSSCSACDSDSCADGRSGGDAAEFADLEVEDKDGDVAAPDSAAETDNNRRELTEEATVSETANDSIPNRRDKIPADDELDDFFTAAEKDIQQHFINKYNFDVIKDEPLEGRYEWIQILSNP